jgi:hypothetical protein
MIFKFAGTISRKNIKIAVALILSNLFFFVLFGGPDKEEIQVKNAHPGHVEVQIRAELLTPFHLGKKVALLHRTQRRVLEGMLEAAANEDGKFTVWVKEAEAPLLFQFEGWEIAPHIKGLQFKTANKGEGHEIRY